MLTYFLCIFDLWNIYSMKCFRSSAQHSSKNSESTSDDCRTNGEDTEDESLAVASVDFKTEIGK